MLKLPISLFLSFLLLFASCFSGLSQSSDIIEGCLPLTVNFTAPASTTSHYWDFGDASTANIANPSNTYVNSGTYNVTYQETIGGPVVGTIVIDVYQKPTPNFTSINNEGCAPLTVDFNNNTVLSNGININNLTWVFSNGGNSTGQSPSYTFSSSGNYNVSLSITTNFPSCNSSQQYFGAVNVSNPPLVSISTNPTPPIGCSSPFAVSFQNGSSSPWGPLTSNWDLGNSNTSTATVPPGQNYTTGNYTVKLVVTDTLGCADSTETFVNVTDPIAFFLISDTVCINTDINLINQSSTGLYTWTFDSGTSLSTSSQTSPTISFSTSGYHSIHLNVFGACAADTTIIVFVDEVDATFTSIPTYSCSEPLSVQFIPDFLNGETYLWEFETDTFSSAVSPAYDYYIGDTTVYSINGPYIFNPILTVTSSYGCVSTFTIEDTIHKPNALYFPNRINGCVPLTINFTDSSTADSDIVNWEWHFGDGTIMTSANNQSQSHVYNAVGVFESFLIVTTANGCIDTSYSVPISVGDNIIPNVSVSPTVVCPGEPVSFIDITSGPFADSIDAWHYYSEESRQFSCFDQANTSWGYFHQTGVQDITMSVEFNGCYSHKTFNGLITVNGPIAGINYTLDCAAPQQINFSNTSQDATSYLWNFGDGSASSTDINPIHTYAASGNYLVSLIASSSSSGCTPDTALITVYVRNLEAGITVDTILCQGAPFNLSSTNSVDVFEACNRGYTWYFSDTLMRPLMTDDTVSEIKMNQSGLNQITLIVKDVNNCVDTATASVTVFGITSNFSMSDTSICLPVSIDYTDLSTSDTTIINWKWIFADDQTSTDTNVTYVYNDPNNILNPTNTKLIIDNAIGCSDTLSIDMIIYEPISTITADDITICAGTVVNFQATDFTSFGSNLNFNWNFDNDSTSTLQNPSSPFFNEGNYHVVLTYDEVSTGCADSSEITILVKDFPVADFSSSADSGIYACPNDNIIFTNNSIGTSALNYAWDFGNGLSANIVNPGTVYNSNGNYTVQLFATIPAPYNCSDSISKEITVLQPYGDFFTIPDLNGDTICRLEIVEFRITDTNSVGLYYWDFGDGTGAAQESPVFNQYNYVPPSGSFTAKLIIANEDGSCPFIQTQPINIFDVSANFIRNGNDLDTAICPQPYPLQNTSSNASSFYWDFGDGQTSNMANIGTHVYDQPGTYDVTLGVKSNELTCTDTITKTIIIFENPDVALTNDTICEGDYVQLHPLNIDLSNNYLWFSIPSLFTGNDTSAILTDKPTTSTTYYLTATDTNTCNDSDTAFVLVYNSIQIPDFDTVIVVGDSIYLPMPYESDGFTFVWEPETGLSCTDCPNPKIQPLSDIIYSLTISDNHGCFTDDVTYNIKVHPETFISLPTTFTPNGDGNNDVLYAKGWGIKELVTFQIFNRWGELVFETTDKEVGWNGYHHGILQNNDVYLVQIVAKTWRDEEKTMSSYINLLR